MTRKDYVLLAQEVAAQVAFFRAQPYGETQLRGLRRFAEDLSKRLHGENRRFDPERFVRDCGLT